MKPALQLHLPPMRDYFCGRRPSCLARAARRRGNAAGLHGGERKYGARERRRNRREERDARFFSP